MQGRGSGRIKEKAPHLPRLDFGKGGAFYEVRFNMPCYENTPVGLHVRVTVFVIESITSPA